MMGKPQIYPLEILLIESNSKNIGLVKKMLDSTKIHYKLHLVNSPNESLAFLQKEGKHEKALEVFDEILKKYKNNVNVIYAKSRSKAALEKYPESLN